MTEKNLEIKDILIARDFEKLKPAIGLINEKINTNYTDINQLYQDREEILKNEDAYEVIKEYIFAGRVSIKFWRIDDSGDPENILLVEEIIKTLDFYNKHLINVANNRDINSITPYSCIALEKRKYLIRFVVPDSDSKKDNGIEVVHLPQSKNIISIIDLENKYIEVRGDYKLSKKIIKYMEESFKINGITEIFVLHNYRNDIKRFKESFENAMFTNVKSIPSNDSPLREQDVKTLISTLNAMNKFFADKDYKNLEQALRKVDIDSNEIGFIPLLLSGLSKIGISSKLKSDKDITNQPMYKLLESYLSHQSGHLRITDLNGEEYSINVGLKTNNIVFKSGKTNEKFISIIRNKIINNTNSYSGGEKMIDISQSRTYEGIRAMARSGIESFTIEYFAKIMKTSTQKAFNALFEFCQKSDDLKMKYEVRCSDCLEELLEEFDEYSSIPFNKEVLCNDCDKNIYISNSNIFIKYHISHEVTEATKESISLIPEIEESGIPNEVSKGMDMESLIANRVLEIFKDNIMPTNSCIININNGTANSVGNNNKILESQIQ